MNGVDGATRANVARPEGGGWGSELVAGLHITKCAGTSLMTTVRRQLTEEQYYLCSSFHGNLVSGRPLFGDIVHWGRVRFVFGHYVNEDLLQSLGERRVFFFTILREPIGRAISHYLHLNAVRLKAGTPRLGAAEYLAQQQNTMCVELLRCFPSLAKGPGTLADKACRALALFDHVGDSDRYGDASRLLLGKLGLAEVDDVHDNVTDQRLRREDFEGELALLRAGAPAAFAQDLLLYERAKPHLGRADFPGPFAAGLGLAGPQGAPQARRRHLRQLGAQDAAAQRFGETERKHLVAEMRMLGRTDWAKTHLDARIAAFQKIRDALS